MGYEKKDVAIKVVIGRSRQRKVEVDELENQ